MEISVNLLNWIATGERGVSSETIVTKLTGIDLVRGRGSEPYDPSDFRRCLLLLEAVPELKPKMERMKNVSKYWKLLIENWSELEKLYHEEKHTSAAPKLYARMAKMREDEMKAKTIPIIRKTALLDEWVIITRYTKKDDYILAHIKYPIPKKDIEYIANDWFISQLKDLGYEKGFSYETGSEEEGTLIKVTVERIQKKKDSEETITIAGVEVLKDNDIFTVGD